MKKRHVSFKTWLQRLIDSGVAGRMDDYRLFGVPFTRGRVLVIVAWKRNYGAPTNSKPSVRKVSR